MSERAVELFSCDAGFPADSLFLDGHFPGNPIVPGAVLLGQLARCLRPTGRGLARVDRMKFLRTLGPDTPFEITLLPGTGADRVEFRDALGPFATARVLLRKLRLEDG